MMSKKLIVSNDVFDAVVASKKTADEIIREALQMTSSGLNTREGVFLPEGTDLLAWYKDRPYYAKVRDNQIEIMGENFNSVSAAAKRVTKSQVNGWTFWQCKLPGKSEFVSMEKLRTKRRNPRVSK